MEGKITRVTLPTASFSLSQEQIDWIEAEAKRLGIKKSVLVRQILDDAMSNRSNEGQAA